jgi:hypothetical protein
VLTGAMEVVVVVGRPAVLAVAGAAVFPPPHAAARTEATTATIADAPIRLTPTLHLLHRDRARDQGHLAMDWAIDRRESRQRGSCTQAGSCIARCIGSAGGRFPLTTSNNRAGMSS